jgi:hypothetical protein
METGRAASQPTVQQLSSSAFGVRAFLARSDGTTAICQLRPLDKHAATVGVEWPWREQKHADIASLL